MANDDVRRHRRGDVVRTSGAAVSAQRLRHRHPLILNFEARTGHDRRALSKSRFKVGAGGSAVGDDLDGLPPELAKDTSIKNGWTLIYDDGDWHLNCLAIHPDWVLAILTRYPGTLGKAYGANICKQVTQQLVTISQ